MPMKRTPTPLLASFKAGSDALDGVQCRVGWLESGHYLNGTPVAYVASIQEFGSEAQGIPSRASVRPTMAEQGAEWSKQMGYGAIAVVNGNLTADQVMNQLGAAAAGDVRKAIAQVTSPALSESTLAARRARGNSSTKPLVDSAFMINTLTHSVTRGDE